MCGYQFKKIYIYILSVCHFLPPVNLIGYIFRDKDPLHLFFDIGRVHYMVKIY